MPDKNNKNALWIVVFFVGLGILLWIVTQCSLTLDSNQTEYMTRVQAGMLPLGGIAPVPGGVSPSYIDQNNFPNPNFYNLTVPLDREMQKNISEQSGEPNSGCMLRPGSQCHVASGGLGTCDEKGHAQCNKPYSTLFNMTDRTTGALLSEEIKKKI